MSALVRDVQYRSRGLAESASFVLAHGVRVYAGSLVAIDSDGYARPWSDVAGYRLAGIALEGAVGNTSLGVPLTVRCAIAPTLESVSFADAAQSLTLEPVFCSTDSLGDCQADPTTNVGPVAIVVWHRGSERADLRILSPAEHLALS
jgi:hypothetical protein